MHLYTHTHRYIHTRTFDLCLSAPFSFWFRRKIWPKLIRCHPCHSCLKWETEIDNPIPIEWKMHPADTTSTNGPITVMYRSSRPRTTFDNKKIMEIPLSVSEKLIQMSSEGYYDWYSMSAERDRLGKVITWFEGRIYVLWHVQDPDLCVYRLEHRNIMKWLLTIGNSYTITSVWARFYKQRLVSIVETALFVLDWTR